MYPFKVKTVHTAKIVDEEFFPDNPIEVDLSYVSECEYGPVWELDAGVAMSKTFVGTYNYQRIHLEYFTDSYRAALKKFYKLVRSYRCLDSNRHCYITKTKYDADKHHTDNKPVKVMKWEVA